MVSFTDTLHRWFAARDEEVPEPPVPDLPPRPRTEEMNEQLRAGAREFREDIHRNLLRLDGWHNVGTMLDDWRITTTADLPPATLAEPITTPRIGRERMDDVQTRDTAPNTNPDTTVFLGNIGFTGNAHTTGTTNLGIGQWATLTQPTTTQFDMPVTFNQDIIINGRVTYNGRTNPMVRYTSPEGTLHTFPTSSIQQLSWNAGIQRLTILLIGASHVILDPLVEYQTGTALIPRTVEDFLNTFTGDHGGHWVLSSRVAVPETLEV
jgi:hypothetical protein